MIWLLYDTWGLSPTLCRRVVVWFHGDWIHCNYHRLGMSRQLPIMVVKNTAQEILRFGYPGNSAITATHILWRSNNDWQWWEEYWPVRTEQSRVYFCWSCVSSSMLWKNLNIIWRYDSDGNNEWSYHDYDNWKNKLRDTYIDGLLVWVSINLINKTNIKVILFFYYFRH